MTYIYLRSSEREQPYQYNDKQHQCRCRKNKYYCLHILTSFIT
ncbi:MAG TPA: hypothetical protein DCZ71_08385 [Ruminococcus sp.]|nr:hypothetical protein [Ruminococcus sp.]